MLFFDDSVLKEALKNFFDYDSFRPGQLEIIRQILNKRDLLVVMPTGAGKSLCYQLVASILDERTIVISPLVAQMDDQIASLNDIGVMVESIHPNRSWDENANSWKKFIDDEYANILFLGSGNNKTEIMSPKIIKKLKELNIETIIIDDAHSISRENLAELSTLKRDLPKAQVVAFTSLANYTTTSKINQNLFEGRSKTIQCGFDRPNLSLTVELKSEKYEAKEILLDYIKSIKGESGIVYCLTDEEADDITRFLCSQSFNAVACHFGKESERQNVQRRFKDEADLVIVTTNGFEIKIDKPNIRFVAHTSLPSSAESYCQEISHAGRDDKAAQVLLLYNIDDIFERQRMIFDEACDDDHKTISRKGLQDIIDYCETDGCRRKRLPEYFGEHRTPCGHCDNCLTPPQTADFTAQARVFISAVDATGQRYQSSYLADVIRGKATSPVRNRSHHELPCFGRGSELTTSDYDSLFRQMIARNILEIDFRNNDAIKLTKSADLYQHDNKRFKAKKPPKDIDNFDTVNGDSATMAIAPTSPNPSSSKFTSNNHDENVDESNKQDIVGKTGEEQILFIKKLLKSGLAPFVEQKMLEHWGVDWLDRLNQKRRHPITNKKGSIDWDTHGLLTAFIYNWKDVFEDNNLRQAERSYAYELLDIRNKHAHDESINLDDALRALDSAQRLLSAISATEEAKKLSKAHEQLARFRWCGKIES